VRHNALHSHHTLSTTFAYRQQCATMTWP
jgi:hypothetical protein